MTEEDTFNALRRVSFTEITMLVSAASMEVDGPYTWDEWNIFLKRHGWTRKEYEIYRRTLLDGIIERKYDRR